MKKIVIGALIVIALGWGGWYWLSRRTPRVVKQAETRVYSGEVTVSMTADGFVPDVFTITRGTTVHFVNNDTYGHWPASDLHPSHLLYPEFDPKRVIAPKETWSFTFEKIGEWPMHDHLAPYLIGKITVKE